VKNNKVNHINILDDDSKVYCHKLNKVELLEKCSCRTCVKFNGTAQGRGVECSYPDTESEVISVTIYDAYTEFKRLNP